MPTSQPLELNNKQSAKDTTRSEAKSVVNNMHQQYQAIHTENIDRHEGPKNIC